MPLTADAADDLLNAVANATPWSVSEAWLQLHIGDPGAAGTANVATHTTRHQLSFGAPGAGTAGTRRVLNDAVLELTSYPATESVTHVSLWTDDTAGDFVLPGTVTGGSVVAGGTLRFEAGSISLTTPIDT